jgi:hypothetical protein
MPWVRLWHLIAVVPAILSLTFANHRPRPMLLSSPRAGAQCVAEGLDRKCLVDELRGRVGLIAFEVLLPSGVDCRQDRAARIDFPYLGGGLAWVRSTQPYQGFANAERPV